MYTSSPTPFSSFLPRAKHYPEFYGYHFQACPMLQLLNYVSINNIWYCWHVLKFYVTVHHFIQFPVDRHLDSFYLFSITNKFAVNILHASLCSYEYFLRTETKEEYLLDHRVWGVGLFNFARHTNWFANGLFQVHSYQLQYYFKET